MEGGGHTSCFCEGDDSYGCDSASTSGSDAVGRCASGPIGGALSGIEIMDLRRIETLLNKVGGRGLLQCVGDGGWLQEEETDGGRGPLGVAEVRQLLSISRATGKGEGEDAGAVWKRMFGDQPQSSGEGRWCSATHYSLRFRDHNPTLPPWR